MAKSQQAPMTWEVLEKMPQILQAPERAITLLGSMLKAELRCKARRELKGLVGCLPTPQMAPAWKLALKRRIKSFIEQPADIPQPSSSQSEVSP